MLCCVRLIELREVAAACFAIYTYCTYMRWYAYALMENIVGTVGVNIECTKYLLTYYLLYWTEILLGSTVHKGYMCLHARVPVRNTFIALYKAHLILRANDAALSMLFIIQPDTLLPGPRPETMSFPHITIHVLDHLSGTC